MEFEPIIGLEIHVQPKTKSKMFCRCSADIFGAKPNSHVCPVCLGLPGTLPVINKEAIEKAILLGLVLNCQISRFSKFDRKNYFYPDLPKGYQISQYDQPIATNGSLKIRIKNSELRIRIRRVHVEEDTGKILHKRDYSLIDFNRSGMPLIEVVTEPDLRSAREVGLFLRKLQLIIRDSKISGADMEKGTMRLEPNVSVREVKKTKSGDSEDIYPDYKVEIKNINSFKFVEKAVTYEINRQLELLKQGKKIKQETRGWDEKKQETVKQRSKEETQDYRYFPEPDLPPLRIEKEWREKIRSSIPELHEQKAERFRSQYGISEKYLPTIISDRSVVSGATIAEYIEEAVECGFDGETVANFIINRPEYRKIPPEKLKEALEEQKRNIVSDETLLRKIIEEVIVENPKPVEDFKKGKDTAIKFLIGQVMKKSKGKADPKIVSKILKKYLKQ